MVNKYLYIFIISAIPVIEQRGAIPIGILMGLNPIIVFLVSYVGSLLPVVFVFYAFNYLMDFLRYHQIFPKLVEFIDRKIGKNVGKFEKYKELALITFIGIPLPTTGVWTGAAIAAFLKLDFKKALFCAMIGALLSAIIITFICILVPGIATNIF